MDEKPFVIGKGGRYIICHKKGLKRPTTMEDGNRESVTVLEAASCSGEFIPPLILISGAKAQIGRFRHLIDDKTLLPGARISLTPNGYIDRENFSYYIEHHFHPLTKPSNPNEHRLLFLDGHDSHLTYRTLQFCFKNNIHIICYPGHSTHFLQPLDVGVFSPLANYYKQESLEWTRVSFGGRMKVCDFFPCLHRARQKACTAANIQAGFRGAGIHPFNPDHVLAKLSNSDIIRAEESDDENDTCQPEPTTPIRFQTPPPIEERLSSLPFKTPKTSYEIRALAESFSTLASGSEDFGETCRLVVEKLSKVAITSKASSVLDHQAKMELATKLKESQRKTADRREIPLGFQATTEEIREKARQREASDDLKKAKKAENQRKKQEKTLLAQFGALGLEAGPPASSQTPCRTMPYEIPSPSEALPTNSLPPSPQTTTAMQNEPAATELFEPLSPLSTPIITSIPATASIPDPPLSTVTKAASSEPSAIPLSANKKPAKKRNQKPDQGERRSQRGTSQGQRNGDVVNAVVQEIASDDVVVPAKKRSLVVVLKLQQRRLRRTTRRRGAL